MLNNFVAVGRLTKDPETRKANNDSSICEISLAIDNTLKENDGTRATLFLNAKAFGNKADVLSNYCHKGSKVAVSGGLNQRNFIRKDGSKGSVIELVIDDIELLDPKPQEPKEPETSELPEDPLPWEGETQEAKFDPYTGKPLKPKAKK